MSLISDALKRQEQLRAPGTGAAQREVSAERPPAGNREQGIGNGERGMGNGEPLNRQTGKTSDTLSGSASSAALRDNPAPHHKPSNRQTVKPSNPFLARERAAAQRPNHAVLLMPVIGLLMLLALLFLRREFVPQEKAEEDLPHTPRKVEEPAPAPIVQSRDDPARAEGTGNREQGTGSCRSADGPSAYPKTVDEARPSQTVDEAVKVSDGAPVQVQREAVEPSALRQSPDLAAPAAQPSNRQTVKPSNQAVEAVPQQPAWPAFTLTGIAVGRERIAVLSTGEMLLAGETSRCGVTVEKVNASTVVFAWGGETKTLRKGEHSDKPADQGLGIRD